MSDGLSQGWKFYYLIYFWWNDDEMDWKENCEYTNSLETIYISNIFLIKIRENVEVFDFGETFFFLFFDKLFDGVELWSGVSTDQKVEGTYIDLNSSPVTRYVC